MANSGDVAQYRAKEPNKLGLSAPSPAKTSVNHEPNSAQHGEAADVNGTKELKKWTPDSRMVRPAILLATAITLGTTIWALILLLTDRSGFVVYSPGVHVGVEASAGAARLFGALVLTLFPDKRNGGRFAWIAAGLLVLGLGGLGFGYLASLFGDITNLNISAYESIFVWSSAGAFFAVGLVPKEPPKPARGLMLSSFVVLGVLGIAITLSRGALPPLLDAETSREAVALGEYLPGPFTIYWVLAAIPLLLALIAAWGAFSNYMSGSVPGWLLISTALLVGTQLHSLFWASTYSPVLATSDLLQLAFAVAVAAGAVLELRHVALELRKTAFERAQLLTAERETTRLLKELSLMKADFTAMVAHELHNPLFAIRGFADMLSMQQLDSDAREQAIRAIREEANALDALAREVRDSARIEREDFTVEARPVQLAELIDQAITYARVLPGNHPIRVVADERPGEAPIEGAPRMSVMADPGRIGQVLRNLLSNAAKYSPAKAPIEIRTVSLASHVRIEVADHGRGIHSEDLGRIFGKFTRGRDALGQKVAGAGLGLYLSQRIVRAHGGDLVVKHTPGGGAVFAFELKLANEDGP